MSFLRFLKSRQFWLSLLGSIVLLVLLFFGLTTWLGSHTRHGETISVPNLLGLTEEQLDDLVEEKGLQYNITDSIYHPKVGRKGVVEQDPAPDMLVKKGRTIYLTMNSSHPPKVKLPDLTDLSLRQATATLETYGLKPGRLIYVPDIAYNAVLRLQINGEDVEPGLELVKGTVVDLVLGEGQSGEPVLLPMLVGLTYSEAVEKITQSSFNLGSVVIDGAVEDTLSTFVFRQIPAFKKEEYLNAGSMIDIFITPDPAKVPQIDTTNNDGI